MKIEQIGQHYRIRKMYNGKSYCVTVPYKPTQKEAIQLIAKAMENTQASHPMSFARGYEDYIASKCNVLSPATIRGYDVYFKAIPDRFKNMRMSDISQADIQKLINDYSVDHAPKSVRNLHSLISAVLGLYNPNMAIRTTLPQKSPNTSYIPTDSDIQKVLEYAKGTMFEIPLWLGCCGMRRGEILALKYPDDIDGNVIHINKALVRDSQGNWVIKQTKTTESTRDIIIPCTVADLIRSQEAFYKGAPNSIFVFLDRAQKELELQHFSFHSLRHYYCSMAHSLGIPDAFIQQAGGWKTDSVMKSVYRHALADRVEEQQLKAVSYLDNLVQNPVQN